MLLYYYTLELYRKGELVKEFEEKFFTRPEASLFAHTYLKTIRKKSLEIKILEHKMLSLDDDIEIPEGIEERLLPLPAYDFL